MKNEVRDARSDLDIDEEVGGFRLFYVIQLMLTQPLLDQLVLKSVYVTFPQRLGPASTYMYKILFKDLGVRVPLSSYYCEMLCVLNVASSQLHLNGSASMRAFETLCECLRIELTAVKFLSFFRVKLSRPQSWVSL